jgi:hypothetical protein
MIKSNELKKGNYVLYNDKYCSVTQLFWDGLEVSFTSNGKQEYFTCKYEDVSPIDLTVDVLEKCDLVKHERFHYSNVFLCTKTNFTINQLRDNLEISYGVSSTPAIVAKGNLSLHQLQNLYFALHNEELGIKF